MQHNTPKPYDKPDQSGNIFNPKDRIIKTIPFKRAVITDAEYLGPGRIPTLCTDTADPRIVDVDILINFCNHTDALQNPDVFRILMHDRYEDLENEQARRETETPEAYIRRHNPELSDEEVKAKVSAEDYPADVGRAYADREIIHEHLHLQNLEDDEQATAFMTDHIAKIARYLYEHQDPEGKHTVCTLDVYDTLINALPDIDYLAVCYANTNVLQFVREVMDAIGYTGYIANPFIVHGGKYTGKKVNDMTDKDVEEFGAPTMTRKQLALLLDANIDRLRRKQKAGAGE